MAEMETAMLGNAHYLIGHIFETSVFMNMHHRVGYVQAIIFTISLPPQGRFFVEFLVGCRDFAGSQQ